MNYLNAALTMVELNNITSLPEEVMTVINTECGLVNAESDNKMMLSKWTVLKATEALLKKHEGAELEFHTKRTMEASLRTLTVRLKPTCGDLLPMIEKLLYSMAEANYAMPEPLTGLMELIARLDERFTDSVAAAIESYICEQFDDDDEDTTPTTNTGKVETVNVEEVEEEEEVPPVAPEIKKESGNVINTNTEVKGDAIDIATVLKDVRSAIDVAKGISNANSNACVTLEVKVTNFKVNKVVMDTISEYFKNVDITNKKSLETCVEIFKIARDIKSFNKFDILMKVDNVEAIKSAVLEYLLETNNI